ncbi:MAG TPA: rRNA maturation RNase YbeY [Trichocoleus sp.]
MIAQTEADSGIQPQIEVMVEVEHPEGAIATEAEWQSWFQTWLEAMQVNRSPIRAYEVGLQLTDDATVHQLNATYRQQDKPTDVLSFAALENEAPQVQELLQSEPLYLGDIIISLDTAQRQAAEQGHSLRQEILWLSVHGFLHLLGWDHPDDESLVKMLAKQAELLEKIGLSQGESS